MQGRKENRSTQAIQKLWGLCHTLRDEGIDCGDYIEQLTYLLFLKISDEREIDLTKAAVRAVDLRKTSTTLDCSWPALLRVSTDELTGYYASVLVALSQRHGVLGEIFSGAGSGFTQPKSLKKLLTIIDEIKWSSLEVNLHAEVFEGLLERAASAGKKCAGQYFTPRQLVKAVVRCVKPDPREREQFKVCDPACGTGEFLVSSYEWLLSVTNKGNALDGATANRVKAATYFGRELVARPRRLALMNFYLHDLEPQILLGDSIYGPPSDERFDCILTNPPFGTRGTNHAPRRDDFTIATSDKQLNFLQHVLTTLREGGRTAVVVSDNCLFSNQAGEVLKLIAEVSNLHTVLRLPNGTFAPYSAGTKTNVLFFNKGYPTEAVWIYDARTNIPQITKKNRPLTADHFAEFERCYGKDPNGQVRRKTSDSREDRWRKFSIAEMRSCEYKLDALKWMRDESFEDLHALPPPDKLAIDAIGELKSAIKDINEIVAILRNNIDAKVDAISEDSQ